MIHKGDLVEMRNTEGSLQENSPVKGVALCDPYVTTVTETDAQGKAVYTAEKIVVDLLVGTKLMSKYPVVDLLRCS